MRLFGGNGEYYNRRGIRRQFLCNSLEEYVQESKRQDIAELIDKFQFNYEQAVYFDSLSRTEALALFTWFLQGRLWTIGNNTIPMELYCAITAHLINLSDKDSTDFYIKIAFFFNKEFLTHTLNECTKKTRPFLFFKSFRTKAEQLAPILEEKNNLTELLDTMEKQKKGHFYLQQLEKHHNRLLSI